MQLNRGLLFWGVALVTAGVVALAVSGGLLARDLLADAWRLWPLILVAIGVGLLLSRTPLAPLGVVAAGALLGLIAGALFSVGPGIAGGGCGPGEPETTEQLGGSLRAQSAEVVVDFNCGDLEITTVDGTDWSLEAAGDEEDSRRVDEEPGRLELSTGGGDGIFGFGGSRNEWQLQLPTDPTLDLDVSTNAGTARLALDRAQLSHLDLELNAGELELDLSDTQVYELEIGMNAASATLRLADASVRSGQIEANAASLAICAPDDLALAITLEDAIAFSHDLDESGLTRSGHTWAAGEEGSAEVTLHVEGNAANLEYNPPEEC